MRNNDGRRLFGAGCSSSDWSAMPVELVDCHTHTVFSDGKSTFRENLCAAAERGITTIACTDHWGRPDFVDCSIEEARLGEYAQATAEVQQEFPDIEVIHGLEADWYAGCAADLAQTRGNATFLLGSIHYLQEKALDWEEDMRIWHELGADALWKLYAEEWCKAATSGLFDSMAHPDLPRLFWLSGFAPAISLDPLFDTMAEAAREGGVHVEINTAGLTKDFADFYPQEALLSRFHAAGVPLTVGSDAHHCSRIGENILSAYRYALRIGYTAIDCPTAEGGWRTIDISQA